MSTKKIPQRQCIGCGEMKSKREMIRILKTPEGNFTLDATGRKGLDRSFKMAIPKEIYEALEKEMKHLG